MIVVTGGAGFIGSNLVTALAAHGATDTVVVDHPRRAHVAAKIADGSLGGVVSPADFLDRMERCDPAFDSVNAVVHLGARTSTLDDDGPALIAENYEYSQRVLALTTDRSIPLVYASSAAVYGRSDRCTEDPGCEGPLNLYANSKWLFDTWVRERLPTNGPQVAGLRFFNVYGPGEDHKGVMASMVTRLDDQISSGGTATLFGEGCGAAAGEHRRDHVHVDDVVRVIRWFLERPDVSGIFNCGTGASRTFNDVAAAVIAARGRGRVEFVDFPPQLIDRYQPDTRADLTRLRSTGCDIEFVSIEDGIAQYLSRRTPVGVS